MNWQRILSRCLFRHVVEPTWERNAAGQRTLVCPECRTLIQVVLADLTPSVTRVQWDPPPPPESAADRRRRACATPQRVVRFDRTR
jgi:hypothetical protein